MATTTNSATNPAIHTTIHPTIPATSPQVPDQIRSDVMDILHEAAEWEGPFPSGGLAHHLDSMQRLALVVAIEDHFQICFEPEDEQRIHDFDDLLRSVAAKLEQRQ